MIYLDTSVLIAALTPEATTERICHWLTEHEAGTLYVSGWTLTEVSSALSIKVRTAALNLEQRADVLANFTRLVEQSLIVIPITASNYEAAARFCDQVHLNLRAGDALHLAAAAARGLTLATLDERLANASMQLGVAVVQP